MKIRLGELNAKMLCQFTAFAEVVNRAFGDGEGGSSSGEKREDLAQAPSYEQALGNINRALSFG